MWAEEEAGGGQAGMGVYINDVDSMRGVRIWRGEGVVQRGREGQRHGPAAAKRFNAGQEPNSLHVWMCASQLCVCVDVILCV